MNVRVRLSGLTKQDYVIRRLQERAVVVQGSSRVYKALRNQMEEILAELRQLENAGGASEEFCALLRLVSDTVDGMRKSEADVG